MLWISGYASSTSVLPGQQIAFHISARSQNPLRRRERFTIDILRLTNAFPSPGDPPATPLHRGSDVARDHHPPPSAPQRGCGWPVAYRLDVPNTWPSGVYIARVRHNDMGVHDDIPFVVKANPPDRPRSRILMACTVSTSQAYNFWGGQSLYGHLDGQGNRVWGGQRAYVVSFDRPYDGLHELSTWEVPFIRWLEDEGFDVDFCTSIDLHADPQLLDPYCLLVSVGHDEYWSKEMRDNTERFIGNGGNVAFFSGNVCWWQVRFENNNRQMVCYKDRMLDPLFPFDRRLNRPRPGGDHPRVTVNWHDYPVLRPENAMTGVSFRNGAWRGAAKEAFVGYTVAAADHWVFGGTGFSNGDEFGRDPGSISAGTRDYDNLVDYETDAAELDPITLSPTYNDGTPRSFRVLALADLRHWRAPPGQTQPGWATMGIYQRGGTVFTSGTTNWSRWLARDPRIARITRNVLLGLCPQHRFRWRGLWERFKRPARWWRRAPGAGP